MVNALDLAKLVKPFAADDPQRAKNLSNWHDGSHPLTKNPDGTPKTVYHGTASDFRAFQPTISGEYGGGIYLTDLPQEAANYANRAENKSGGANVMPLHIKMNNPYIVRNTTNHLWDDMADGLSGGKQLSDVMKQKGYDGIISTRPYMVFDQKTRRAVNTGFEQNHFIAFDPSQMKSALGNNGNFSASSSQIDEHTGGYVTFPSSKLVRDDIMPPISIAPAVEHAKSVLSPHLRR